MRPIATFRSELRYPLDVLLGTKGQIRVLRLLSESDRAMSASEVQNHTGISLTGTLKVLNKLAKAGLLNVAGAGRSKLFSLEPDNALAASIRKLFEAEHDWHATLISELRGAFSSATHPVDAAWMVSDGYSLGAPLEIGFLTSARLAAETKSEMRERLLTVEKEFDVPIELSGFTRIELSHVEPRDFILLAGHPPFSGSDVTSSPTSHQDLDARSLRRAEQLAQMIRRDPTIVSRTREYVNRTLERDSDIRHSDLAEWQQILKNYSSKRLLEFLTGSGPRATRLRQSSPFLAVLTPDERTRIRDLVDSDDD